MVLSYAEFMTSTPVSRFPSGHDANRPLARAFKKKNQKSDQSPKRMERLKKMLSESKTGRQTLEFLKGKGSQMIFEPMDYYGYFSPDKNLVALNPAMSDEDLAVTFVHEVRHAWQDSKMDTLSPEMTPKSFFLNGFEIEADACAAEVMYAHEMREKNPKIWEAHQKSPYAPMSTAFEKEFEKTGDLEKARMAALLTWYELPLKKNYADQYVDYMCLVAKELTKQKELEPQYFAENRTAQKIADTLGKDYDGKKFLKDAKALETPERLSINEKQARKLANAMLPYMAKYHRTAEDLGLDKLYVNRKDGTRVSCSEIFTQVKKERQKKAAKAKDGKDGR
ncbi:MAG: hypothetical protein J5787_02190 [Alphaproteobacteria bacterium]|nr:hypothetical protein [Alphaproteobacteria bacterium]MBO4643974.1 hypothetical protein [Alphaproteobacteria bacterium]